MKTITLEPTFESWQAAARTLLREGVPPADVRWREGSKAEQPSLLDEASSAPAAKVPRQFLDLARRAAAAPDPERWQVLYDTLWRLIHESRDLLSDAGDPGVKRLRALAAHGPVEPGDDGAGAAPFVPQGAGLRELAEAASRCKGCELYRHATQTVFGRGAAGARIVFVGEQPGDQEDRQGAPFVGPAGEILDRALAEVSLPREKIYVTNAVKHFKFELRGKRRIHQTPRANEINACRPWLEAELERIKPDVLVALGATAARVIFGDRVRITRDRGQFAATRWAEKSIATYHPSAVLRGEDDAQKAQLYAMLVEDLRKVARV
ncbi:MAG TPA: UdgX family uracil-DNA binding protein [Methylomirabilota bacterium]|nr:UdgX family uracil-DNA binding protein [Methylomirabilota bacterium]